MFAFKKKYVKTISVFLLCRISFKDKILLILSVNNVDRITGENIVFEHTYTLYICVGSRTIFFPVDRIIGHQDNET